MSDFYVSFTTRDIDAKSVADALSALGRQGFVSPASDGFVVFYDASSDDTAAVMALAKSASERLGKPVLAVMNAEDEVLLFWLYERGVAVDSYNSNPNHLDGGDDAPAGGDADVLSRHMADDADRAAIASILRAANDEESDYPFAVDRHVALCQELGLPADYCCVGYANVAEGSADDIPGRHAFIAV
jgi:hypothetical protein